ncbi:MAG: hypothetical protein M3Q08_01495 [Pseudomonadota bacterium]|nr:hypothetical protein [Pseudomonadota bacterium]
MTNGVAILQLVADLLGIVPLAPDERLRNTDALTAQSPTQGSYEFV